MRAFFLNLLVSLNIFLPASLSTFLVDGLTSQITLVRNTLQHYCACLLQMIFDPSNSIRQNKSMRMISPIITVTIISLLIAIFLAIRLLRLQKQLKQDEQFEYWKRSGPSAISTHSNATKPVNNELFEVNGHKLEEDMWFHEDDNSDASEEYVNNITGWYDGEYGYVRPSENEDEVSVSDEISLNDIKVEVNDEMNPEEANTYDDLRNDLIVPIIR
ncbi:473_t:CDS:1, partial [Paraglomus occultum]